MKNKENIIDAMSYYLAAYRESKNTLYAQIVFSSIEREKAIKTSWKIMTWSWVIGGLLNGEEWRALDCIFTDFDIPEYGIDEDEAFVTRLPIFIGDEEATITLSESKYAHYRKIAEEIFCDIEEELND